MLTEVAEGVWVRQSEWVRSNAIAVMGDRGVLLIDPGVTGADLEELADDLDAAGLHVIAGLSTHPHWDHLLWHSRFGDVPRYATPEGAQVAAEKLDRGREMAAEQAPGAPLELLGLVRPLHDGQEAPPWTGPRLHVVEHRAHAPGHSAIALPEIGVLVAGDMLSDFLIPILDPRQPTQLATYEAALDELERAAAPATVLIPGHGAVAHGKQEIADRIAADRAYLRALGRGDDPHDPRLDAERWLSEVHEGNLRQVHPA